MLPDFAATPEMTEVDGVPVPASFGSLADEVRAIRRSVALSHRPDMIGFRVSGPDAWELLDGICATDLFLRDSQIRHTLALDEAGRVVADVYVGSDDDGFLLLTEGMPAAAFREHVAQHAPPGLSYEIEDLGESLTHIALDGPFAWEVLAALEGPDIAGFPYLSLYHPRQGATYIRAGKTGEYGYSLLVPHADAPGLWRSLSEAGAPMEIREVGLDALWHAQLENWFFNIHREGRVMPCSPVELQLQWRLAREDKQYVGREALRAQRAMRRAVGVVAGEPLAAPSPITHDGREIGTLIVAEVSETLGLPIGIALLELDLAHSGIDRFRVGSVPLRTVSPPFVNNLSLYVSPQRDSWAARDEIAYRGPRPVGLVLP